MSSLIGFIIAITVLVFIHEMGHFLVARFFGVGVRRFSIGFGKPVWSRVDPKTGTEWAIGWAPLGGYVLFVDSREGEIKPEELAKDFSAKPRWQKSLIVLAGPVANLALAILIWTGLFMQGIPEARSFLGDTLPGSPAQVAGFKLDDEVVSVGGKLVSGLGDAQMRVVEEWQNGSPTLAFVVSGSDGERRDLSLSMTALKPDDSFNSIFRTLGWPAPGPGIPALVERVDEDSPADLGGVKSGDEIIAVDGAPVRQWSQFVSLLSDRGDKKTPITVKGSDGSIRELSVIPKIKAAGEPPKIGVYLKRDAEAIYKNPQWFRVNNLSFAEASAKAVKRAKEVTVMTVAAIGKMVSGSGNKDSVSGPVGIAQQAGNAVEGGATPFLSFLAFLSLSLFTMNMLPLPALDGGHLVVFTIESVIRRPLPDKIQNAIGIAGFFFIIALTLFALGTDLMRLI